MTRTDPTLATLPRLRRPNAQPPVPARVLGPAPRPRPGFSLLELLITIAIIVLLVSFLLFAASAVWKMVRRVMDMMQG